MPAGIAGAGVAMKFASVVISLVYAIAVSCGAAAANQPVVGSWKLMSFKVTASDTNETKDALGPNPTGRMILTPNGYLVFSWPPGGRHRNLRA
jgi:hypothetical protein